MGRQCIPPHWGKALEEKIMYERKLNGQRALPKVLDSH